MKSKKIALIISITCIIAILATFFTGCTSTIEHQAGLEMIEKAIQQSLTEQAYYIKERTKVKTSQEGEKDSFSIREIITNKRVNKEKTPYNDAAIKVSDTMTLNSSSLTPTVSIKEWLYGYSVSKDIKKPKKADISEWKPHLYFYNKGEGDKSTLLKEITPFNNIDEFFTLEGTKGHDLTSLLAPLDELTPEDMDFTAKGCGMKKDWNVYFFTFKVLKEGHPYAQYENIQVRILYGKINQIATTDINESYRLDLTYDGPKIIVPSYDTEIAK